MRVAALRVELHIPAPRSLKEKRAVLRRIVEGARRLGSYSVAEVDRHDAWQRAVLGIAIVAPDGRGLESHIGRLRRYLDHQLDVEILEFLVSELEAP